MSTKYLFFINTHLKVVYNKLNVHAKTLLGDANFSFVCRNASYICVLISKRIIPRTCDHGVREPLNL